MTYPNGDTVAFTYTAMGDVQTVTDATGITTYSYVSGTAREMYGRPRSVTDPNNSVWQFQYDSYGRLVGATDPLNNSSSQVLDQYNQVLSLTMPLGLSVTPTYKYSGKPPTSTLISQNGSSRNFLDSFDSQSQLISNADPLGLTNGFTLDGESDLTKLVNGNGKALHQFSFNPPTRSTTVQMGLGANSLSANISLSPTGSVVSTSLLTGGGTTFRTGGASYGLPDPDLPTDIWMSDSVTGWYSETVVNQYDGFGRLSDLITIAPDGNSQIEHTYSYDKEGNLVGDWQQPTLLGAGGLLPTANYPQQTQYTYNPDGTRKQMVIQLAPLTGSNIESVTYNYGYDSGKRLTSIYVYPGLTYAPVSTGTPLVYANYEYDANGNVKIARTNGATTVYQYNALGQLSQLQNLTADGYPDALAPAAYHVADPDNGSDHTIFSAFSGFTYDALGSRTGLSFSAWTGTPSGSSPSTYASGSAVWIYDNGGRLTGESWTGGGSPVNYTHNYDNGGNLTTLRGYSLTPDPSTDQLQSSNIPGYGSPAYNGAGEMTSFNGATVAYSPLGQLTTLSGSTTTSTGTSAYSASMVYDHLGRRAALSESLGIDHDVQFHIYDGDDLVYRQFTLSRSTPLERPDFSGDNGVLYLYGPTGLIMEFDRYGNYRTLLFDPRGSNVSSVHAGYLYGGTITGTTWVPQFYDSYGLPVWTAPGSQPLYLNRATSQPFQYKGQYGYLTDGATGLVYCHNRYYDPNTGRWTSRDPSGLDGGVNVYQYCDADPVDFVDSDGTQIRTQDNELIRWMNTYMGLTHSADSNSDMLATAGDTALMTMRKPGLTGSLAIDLYRMGHYAAKGDLTGLLMTLGSMCLTAADFEIPEEGGEVEVIVDEIRYSHDSIKSTFRAVNGTPGGPIQAMADGLREGLISGDNLGIQLVKKGGKIYSLDNRRVWALKAAGIKTVKCTWTTRRELAIAIKRGKFSTKTDGMTVIVRGTNH